MKIDYEISKSDFIDAMMLVGVLSPRAKAFFLGLFACLLVAVIFSSSSIVGALAFGGMVGVLVFVPLRYRFLAPRRFTRLYQQSPEFQHATSIELLDSGLWVSSGGVETTAPWNRFYAWRQSNKCIVITFGPGRHFAIPKRLKDEGLDVEKLADQLRRNVGEAA